MKLLLLCLLSVTVSFARVLPHSAVHPVPTAPPLPKLKLDLNTTVGFDQSQALRFLYYSYAAYQTLSVGSWTCTYCTAYGPASTFVPVATFSDFVTDGFGYIGYNPNYNEIVISFRGSSSIRNWIQDLQIYSSHTPFGGGSGNVATGFYNVYTALQSAVLTQLRALAQSQSGYNIYVTGHSLGGAVAALCATDLSVNQGYNAISTLTFGEPRVGDGTFANFLNAHVAQVTRNTHADDIVVHLPPNAFGFQHETTEVWNTGSNFKVCSSSNGEDPNCADSVPFYDFSISDHLSYFGVSCCAGPSKGIVFPDDIPAEDL